ncbi:MAG TPA: MFS transporter [Gaiellaceae bacterium]|nr:MFS transporter [Gaiellaceae bacterium]
MEAVRRRIVDSAAAFREVVRNESLRRLEIAWAAAATGRWAYLVAVSVYAYDVGGEAAVGLIFLLRLVPAALIAPFAGILADRVRRERVLLGSLLARVVLIAGAATGVFLDVNPAIVYALAVADAIAATPFRSAQAAMTPSLARSPTELTAANAVASTIESMAAFIGPAIAGLLLGVTSIGIVFLFNVGLVTVSAVFILRLRVPRLVKEREMEARTLASEAVAGFRTIAREPTLRVLFGLFTAQTFAAGAVAVYVVVVAIDLLELGNAGVGYLNSAAGIGALVGGILALSLTGARRLSPAFMLGVVLWGAPLIVLGLWPSVGLALILLAIRGIGNSFVDVAAFTLIQRSVPDEVLARVFGVIQMLWLGSVGIGAMVAPVLIDWLGLEGALIATGVFLPVLVGLFGRQLARIDAEAVAPEAAGLRLLTSVEIFAPLPGTSLEHLAGRLTPLRVDPGTTVIRQGDAGDRFYIIAEGKVEISEDGKSIAELGAGGYFGEIALIRDMPRTATVTARTQVVLYALDREDFLAAVTGHAASAEAADEVVSARLAGVPVPSGTGPSM